MDHSPGWSPPSLAGSWSQAIAQVHCHQHAILGWDTDARLLAAAGVDAERLDSGCCGLAGNFGITKWHGEVSEACAEQVLLPRVREAAPETVVLADGFSCRTQLHDLDSGDREGVHLAELLRGAQRPPHQLSQSAELFLSHRADQPAPSESGAALTGLALACAGAALVMRRFLRRVVRGLRG